MSAPAIDAPAAVAPSSKTNWMPTRKWFAGLITALAAFFVNWINAGDFSKELGIQLVGVLATATVAYLVPNDQSKNNA